MFVSVCLSVCVCVPQLLCRPRRGCWKSSWRPHEASRLLQFLTSLLRLSLQLVTRVISLSGFSFSEAPEVTCSIASVPFSGTQVPAKPDQDFSFLYLLQENSVWATIRHCASCEQLKSPASKWTWPCVTGPLRCTGLCPVWPSANVTAYHIACSNLWKQILAALCGLITVLK